MRNQHWFPGLLVLAAGPIMAADGSLDAARRCAQMQDSLQRLVCYDRIFAAPAGSAAPTAGPVTAPAPAAPGVATAVAVAPVQQSFGSEHLKSSVEERKRIEAPETQKAKVAAVREARPGVWRITLENDQVWQQAEADRNFFISAGDTVVIERGLLGSHHLEQEGGGRRVRVTRVK